MYMMGGYLGKSIRREIPVDAIKSLNDGQAEEFAGLANKVRNE